MNLVKKIFPFITGILSGREEIFPQEELYRVVLEMLNGDGMPRHLLHEIF
jgi:hypothetical protein